MEIEEGKNEIKEIVNSIYNEGYSVKRLSDVCNMQAGKFVSASDIDDNNVFLMVTSLYLHIF